MKLKVSGMSCSGCAAAVTHAIKSAKSDSEVVVDLAAGLVTIHGDIAESAAVQAIEQAGFSVVGRP